MRKSSALLILIVMFFPLAFAAMTLASIRPWILDRGFYERIVSDEHLYDVVLAEELPSRLNRDAFTSGEQLPVGALDIALREVLTPDYLRSQAMHVVDDVFDYIDGRDRHFEVTLDITPIKTALAGEAKTRFAAALAAALPPCDAGQPPIAPNGKLTRCIAADGSVDAVAEQIATALPVVLEGTPDRIVLNNGTPFVRMNWYDYAGFLGGSVQAGMDVAILIMVIVALSAGVVGAYLGGDDLRGRLRWFSSAMFAPGALFLLAGLTLASPSAIGAIRYGVMSAHWGVDYSQAYREAVTNVIVPIIQQIGSGVLVVGGIVCLMALGLLILSWATSAGGSQTRRVVQVPARNS